MISGRVIGAASCRQPELTVLQPFRIKATPMKKTFVFFAATLLLSSALAAHSRPAGAAGAGRRPRPARPQRERRPAHHGRRRVRGQSLQLRGHAKPAAHSNPSVFIEEMTWMDVRDALEGGQDDRHHHDRRHRAERSVAGHRQAQLRAPRQLRRDRPQARQRAVRAEHRSSCPKAASSRRRAT